MAACRTDVAKEEIARVEAAGGWIGDDRVCDVLAVSRAFGDWEFKSGHTDTLLSEGVEYGWWDQNFANEKNITGDLVIATPAVSVTEVSEEAGDEFVVVASDGLWCGACAI
jgi:protein phosphatase 1A